MTPASENCSPLQTCPSHVVEVAADRALSSHDTNQERRSVFRVDPVAKFAWDYVIHKQGLSCFHGAIFLLDCECAASTTGDKMACSGGGNFPPNIALAVLTHVPV